MSSTSRFHDEIVEMFAQLDGRARYEDELESVSARKRREAVERTRQWRLDNRAKFLAMHKRVTSAWAKNNRATVNAARRRRDARYLANPANRAKMRLVWQKNTAAYRARRRAQRAGS